MLKCSSILFRFFITTTNSIKNIIICTINTKFARRIINIRNSFFSFLECFLYTMLKKKKLNIFLFLKIHKILRVNVIKLDLHF